MRRWIALDGWLAPDCLAVADQALVSGATFLSTIVIARAAGVSAFGAFAIFTTSVGLWLSIQAAGVIGPLMTAGVRPSHDDYGEFVGAAFCRALASAAIGAVCLAAVARFTADLRHVPLSCAIVAAAWLFQDFARRMCFVVSRHRLAIGSDAVSYGVQVVWLLALYRTGRLDLVRSIEVIGATSIAGAATTWPIWRVGRWNWRDVRDRVARDLREGGFLIGTAAAQWVTTGGAMLAASAVWGPALAAGMKASQNLMGVCHLWFQGLENSVPSAASALRRSAGVAPLSRYLARLTLAWGGMTLLATMAIAFEREHLVRLVYGRAFAGSGDVLAVYALYYAAAFFAIPAGAGLRACGRTAEVFTSAIAGAAVAACWFVLTATVAPLLAIFGIVVGKCVTAAGMTRRLAPLLRLDQVSAIHDERSAI